MRHIFGENERFWYLAMRIGAPFWHWVERSTNGRFWEGLCKRSESRQRAQSVGFGRVSLDCPEIPSQLQLDNI
jgi:hypothetical protein